MDEKTLEKIKRLLALANHPNTPECEADSARRKVSELYERDRVARNNLQFNFRAQPGESPYSMPGPFPHDDVEIRFDFTITPEQIETEYWNQRARQAREGWRKRTDPIAPSIGKSRMGVFRTREKGEEVSVDQVPHEWPFGWTGKKGEIEIEQMELENGQGIVVGWDCPGCQLHVEKVFDRKAVLRSKGTGAIAGMVSAIRFGVRNQLCKTCWEKFK